MSQSRRSRYVLFAGLLCMGLAGCPSETPQPGSATSGGENGREKRIILITNVVDPFWDTCEAGAMAAEEELKLKDQGYSVTFIQNNTQEKGQIDKLKQYGLESDVVAVGISVLNPESVAVAREMRNLQKNGIKVITFDGDIDRELYRDARFAYLGTDNIVAGREMGKAARVLADENTKYAFFVGRTDAANAVARMDGFVEGMDGVGQEVDRIADGGDRPTARKNVEGALDRDPDINMLVGIWAYNTPQIVNVVRDRNLREKTKIICFDAATEALQAMEAGDVDVMVVQNPYQMGFESVRLLLAMAEDDEETIQEFYPDHAQEGDRDLFRTELRVVVPDGSPISEDLFEPETEFMTFDEFKAWLEERSLTNS